MNRIAIWIANAGLFVLCCYLAAATISEIAAETLVPSSGPAAPSAPAAASTQRPWAERQVILERNLFNASTILGPPTEAATVEQEYEATKLALRLLGTAASSVPALSWAAVEDLEKREHVVVRIQDVLMGRATVVAIERRRIVLDNRGRHEELALEENGDDPRAARRAARKRTASKSTRNLEALRNRVRRQAEQRLEPTPELEIAGRSPAEIFSSARILPKYENGQMVGIQLNNVKPGSLFDEIGIKDGDVITEFNGIQIDSPQGSAEVLREFTQADDYEVEVLRADGTTQTLTFAPD